MIKNPNKIEIILNMIELIFNKNKLRILRLMPNLYKYEKNNIPEKIIIHKKVIRKDILIHVYSFVIVSPKFFDDKFISFNCSKLVILTINPNIIKSVSFIIKDKMFSSDLMIKKISTLNKNGINPIIIVNKNQPTLFIYA